MRFSDPEKVEVAAPPKRSSKRGWLIALGIPLLLVGLGAAVWLYYSLSGDAALQKAFAAADAQDPNWRLEDIEATRVTPPDDQNGALIIRDVHRQLSDKAEGAAATGSPPVGPKLEFFGRPAFDDHPVEMRLRADQIEALTSFLENYEPALLRARSLVHFPKGRIAIVWAKDGISTLLPDLQNVRAVVQLLNYDAMLRAEEGDLEGAFASCQAALHTGRAIGDEPIFISQLVRLACRAITMGQFERTLAQGQLTDETLERMQHLLATEAEEPLLYYGVRGERAIAQRAMTAVGAGQLPLQLYVGLSSNSGYRGDAGLAAIAAHFSMKSSHAYVLNYFTECVELLNRPDPDIDAVRAKEQAVGDDAPFVAKVFLPAIDKYATSFLRNQAQLRCATAALAAERFRMRHGRWPAALSELTPDFLPEPPRDPFDKQPLRMVRSDQGIVIYSIGPDGEDNGGLLRAKQPTGVKQNTDVGFGLWNVDQRRQAAREVLPTMPHEAP